jgi:hypothetical protein
MNNFQNELTSLINRYNEESKSNTPDYILARFLEGCLASFNKAVNMRETHAGRLPPQREEAP